jgi:hypothetical protein
MHHSASPDSTTASASYPLFFHQPPKAMTFYCREGIQRQTHEPGPIAGQEVLSSDGVTSKVSLAAKMIEPNPSLMQLRVLQAVGVSSGNALILGMPPQSTAMPIKPDPTGSKEVPDQPPEEPQVKTGHESVSRPCEKRS